MIVESITDESAVAEELLLSDGRPEPSLGEDRVVWGLAAGLAIAAIPLLFPVFDEKWALLYDNFVDIPFIVCVLLAFRWRLRGVDEVGERRFWNLLFIGFSAWLITSTLAAFLILGEGLFDNYGKYRPFIINAPYLVLYGALAAALEIHPHVRHDPISLPLRRLHWAGSFVLLFGLLCYFLVVPGFSGGGALGFWTSSLALFVALDAYLVLRLWHLRESTGTGEWKSIYSWLLIGTTIWGTGDLLLALMVEGIVTGPRWAALFDLIWPLSFCAIVVATRPAVVQPGYSAEISHSRQPFGMGSLVVYIVAPLALHVTLYRFFSPDPGFQGVRADLALTITAMLAAMTLIYHKLLRAEISRLGEEEALTREQLAHQAFHDELTGLPNRNLFRDRLQLAIENSRRYQSKCAVLFCDLDQFKVINDSFGHEAGDRALVATADRLQAAIRKQDTVARMGGDEFAVIFHNISQALDAAYLAEKLLAAIGEPLVIGSKDHALSCSIGIAVFPDDGEEEEVLLKHADTAMYQAKLHGRNTYRLFTQAMNEAADERLAIERGLRTGLMAEQFRVFYQPIVALETGQPVAFEALLRWKHPERGFISPLNFIDVAEQTGLIVPIGMWVLETACKWAVQLDSTDDDAPSISVNLSPRQLRDPGLIEDVRLALESSGLEPSRLQLEISESMALRIDTSASPLNRLRELGVRISIDDFGTGYAALGQLQGLPVDILKIDRSFVKGIEVNSVSEAIVLAIVNMARVLDFYVVAEGIETESELNIIRQSKCDAVQGYYLCSPMPPEELKQAMAQRNFSLLVNSGQNS